MASRNGIAAIKTAMVRRIRSEFNFLRVPGLAQVPLVIQDRPLNSVDEPYVYIYEEDSIEVDETKSGSSTDYFVIAQVIVRTSQNQDGNTLRDAIVDEVKLALDVDTTDYIDLTLSGFNVYIQNLDTVALLGPYEERGATYYQANMTFNFRADFVGLPVDNLPVQDAIFTFDGFEFTPANNQIELYDAGTITGALTYPSNNNGYDFTGVTYALTADGSISDNVITVGEEDNVTTLTTISYEFGENTAITTQVVDTDTFERIKSLRYGSISSTGAPVFTTTGDTDLDLTNLSVWNTGNRVVDFGVTNPNGEVITITRTAGTYMYIVIDDTFTISSLVHDTLNLDELDEFNVTEVGGYRIYLFNRATLFNDTITLTITAS